MKGLATLLLVVAAIVLGTIALRTRQPSYSNDALASEAVPVRLSGEVPEGYVVRTFDVEGIHCQGCAPELHRALLSVDGVREAAVEPLAKCARVVVRDDVAIATLERALTFDEFTARAR